AGLARLRPNLARVHALFVPAVEVRGEFVADEAARLLLEQHQIFAHPGRAWEIEGFHGPNHLARRSEAGKVAVICFTSPPLAGEVASRTRGGTGSQLALRRLPPPPPAKGEGAGSLARLDPALLLLRRRAHLLRVLHV